MERTASAPLFLAKVLFCTWAAFGQIHTNILGGLNHLRRCRGKHVYMVFEEKSYER